MAPNVRPGSLVPIPCRGCITTMLPFTVDWGRHLLPCPLCDHVTQVDVREERGVVRIRTQRYDPPK